MKNKIAVVTFEVVAESLGVNNYMISRDILDWFLNDMVSIHLVKKVREITAGD